MISLHLVISKVESETYCTHAWWRHPISVSSEPEEQLHENEETVHTEATRQALAWSTTESGVPLGKVMMTDLSDPANTNGRTSRVANVSFILKILRKRSSNISFQMSWMYSARSQSKSDQVWQGVECVIPRITWLYDNPFLFGASTSEQLHFTSLSFSFPCQSLSSFHSAVFIAFTQSW